MGLASHIYHVARASALEEKDCDKAVWHILQSEFESRERKQRAGDILKKAGKYREAIRYYQEAIREGEDRSRLSRYIVECYEALKEYHEAMEVRFAGPLSGEWYSYYGLYKTYQEYRTKSPSFKLSHQRLKEIYKGLCRKRNWREGEILNFSEDNQLRIIAEMEQANCIDEAIEALKTCMSSSIGRFSSGNPKPTEEHFKLAGLYEKKGDFESALQIYEDYNQRHP